jgi:hypothetical protein
VSQDLFIIYHSFLIVKGKTKKSFAFLLPFKRIYDKMKMR